MRAVQLAGTAHHQVPHCDPVEHQGVRDESSVTAPPQRFCAHQRQALPCCDLRLQLGQRDPERLAPHVGGIGAEGGVPPTWLLVRGAR